MRIVLIIILFCQTAYGQTIEWSNTRKLRGNSVYTHVIGQDASGIYLLRQKNRLFSKYVILEKYHHQLGYAFSRSLLLQKSRILNAEVNEHGVFLVLVRFNKSLGQNELLISFYDEQLNPGSFTQKMIDKAPLANYYDKGDFKLAVSKNRKYIAVLHSEMSEQKKRVMSLKLFTNDFQQISEKIVELPFDYDQSAFHDFKLSNDLRSYFILEDVPKKNARKGMLRSSFSLFTYDSSTDSLRDYALSDTSHFLQSLKLNFDHLRSTIGVSGFYSEEHAHKFSGIYTCEFEMSNPDNNRATYTPIPEEIVSTLIGQKKAERGDELESFALLRAVATNRNQLVLVAERNSVSSEEDVLIVNGTPQALARNIYNFDDILVVALDSNKEITWHHVIQKNQSSMNDGGYFGSIALAVTEREINILFNDNMRNSGNVMHYSISSEGKLSDKVLLNSETEYVSIIPGESRQISKNTMLIPTVKNKKFALLKLSYIP